MSPCRVSIFTLDSGFGEHARGLLECGSRQERLSEERCLGYTEKQRFKRRRFAILLLDLLIDFGKGEFVDLGALEEIGIAGIDYLNLLEHLADDDLDMLVVDLHALQTVNLLNFVQQVLLDTVDTVDAQDIVRIDSTLGQTLARKCT